MSVLILIGAIAAFLILTLILFFNRINPGISISAWGDIQEKTVLLEIIEEFKKENPGIRVVLRHYHYNEYVPKNLADLAEGQGSDILVMEIANFPELFYSGVLEPLDPFFKKENWDMGSYYPKMVESFTVGGKVYGIPRDAAPLCVVYYNKKAFRESGESYPSKFWNWHDFRKAAQNLTVVNRHGETARWGVVEQWPMISPWVHGMGGSFADNVNKPSRWTFASDPCTALGMQFRADLILKDKSMPLLTDAKEIGGVKTWYLFAQGTAAMFISGIWKTAYFQETIKDFDWDIALLPKGPGGNGKYTLGGTAYGITRKSRNKKWAWKLVKFITGKEGARKMAATGVAQPALMEVANSPFFLGSKIPASKSLMLDAVDFSSPTPFCSNWGKIQTIISEEFSRVWRGEETIPNAMARLKPILEKNPPQTTTLRKPSN